MKRSPVASALACIEANAENTFVSIGRTVSCLPFTHPHRTPWGGVPALRRETLRVGDRTYKLVSFRGGEWEAYEVDPSGLEMFLGYAVDVIRVIAKAS